MNLQLNELYLSVKLFSPWRRKLFLWPEARIMPRGPNGECRPVGVIGTAVKIMRIATGEEPKDYGNAPGC
jgi:hypothetical protein